MEILKFLVLIVTASGFGDCAKYLAEKPSVLKSCDLNDPNFTPCFTQNFQVLFREWYQGIPGLKTVGSLDPLLVKRVKIHQNSGPALNLDAELENLEIKGASKGQVKEALLDKQRFVTHSKVFFPKLIMESDYKAKGSVLALALNGMGRASFIVDNVVLGFHITLKLRDEDGFTFTDVDKFKCVIESIEGFHIDIKNLFGGQRELEDSANELFNANWRELYELFRPTLEETIQLVLDDRFRKSYAYIPANYFIENIPTAKEFYG